MADIQVGPSKARRPGKTIAISFGQWGGVYWYSGSIGWRLCVGWVAIDYLFTELDTTFRRLLNDIDKLERKRG